MKCSKCQIEMIKNPIVTWKKCGITKEVGHQWFCPSMTCDLEKMGVRQ